MSSYVVVVVVVVVVGDGGCIEAVSRVEGTTCVAEVSSARPSSQRQVMEVLTSTDSTPWAWMAKSQADRSERHVWISSTFLATDDVH